ELGIAESSEFEPNAELYLARRVSLCGRADEAELRVTQVPGRIRLRKAGRIHGIEHLRPQLQGHAFLRHDLFKKIGVEIVNAIVSQTREVARGVAWNLVPGISKAVDV